MPGGGRLLRMCGEGRTETTWRYASIGAEAVFVGDAFVATKGSRLHGLKCEEGSESAVYKDSELSVQRSRAEQEHLWRGEDGRGGFAIFTQMCGTSPLLGNGSLSNKTTNYNRSCTH